VQSLVRVSALQGFDTLVRELGGDPELILTRSHLRVGLLGNPEAYIPFRTMAAVIDRAAADLRCPDFSLRLSTFQSIEILGPIALIARHSSTCRAALSGIAQHMGDYSPALRLGLGHGGSNDGGPGRTRFTFDAVVPGLPSHVQIYQLGLGVSLGIFRLLMGPGFTPLEIAFPHPVPDAAHAYERFFGRPVRFDAEYCGMQLRDADLDRRRSGDDPQVRAHVARFLEAYGPADGDLVAQVRHLIARTLPTGHATTVTVAAHLGLHIRTLQRWLAREGHTFEGLLDDVRRERARHDLTASDMPIGQIAARLGYSQQSALTRASIRWFGTSPRRLREAASSRNCPCSAVCSAIERCSNVRSSTPSSRDP